MDADDEQDEQDEQPVGQQQAEGQPGEGPLSAHAGLCGAVQMYHGTLPLSAHATRLLSSCIPLLYTGGYACGGAADEWHGEEQPAAQQPAAQQLVEDEQHGMCTPVHVCALSARAADADTGCCAQVARWRRSSSSSSRRSSRVGCLPLTRCHPLCTAWGCA